MSERKTACNTYKVEYTCDECRAGTMEASGSVVDTYPPQYQHICNSCRHEGYLETRYPEIRYEPIKALHLDWDAFEKHMNTQSVMSVALDIEKAAQVEQLEREKAELIEKAEGAIAAWDNRFGPALLDNYIKALRDAVERIKHA